MEIGDLPGMFSVNTSVVCRSQNPQLTAAFYSFTLFLCWALGCKISKLIPATYLFNLIDGVCVVIFLFGLYSEVFCFNSNGSRGIIMNKNFDGWVIQAYL
jgi:hypothetical protein